VVILGYTRTGKPVIEPTRGAPDTNNADVFRRTKAKFPGWTKGDHMDAEQLLLERGEQLTRSESPADRKRGRQCTNWASTHWDIGGRWLGSERTT
jgi:hypothetical protein